MENSKIGWTNHTLNPIRGCQVATLSDGVVSPACENCYAENMSSRFRAKNPEKVNVLGEWGIGAKRYFADDKYLNQALRWDRDAKAAGLRERVFVASLSDMFEGETTEGIEGREGVRKDYLPMLEKMWGLMEKTTNLDWLWLTKRPWNMVRYLEEKGTPKNFWAGTTVENQKAADERIPFLLQCRGATIRFLSMEPLLEPVIFQKAWVDRYYWYPEGSRSRHARTGDVPGDFTGTVNWIIVGAESLNKRPGRDMPESWLSIYNAMCNQYGIPFFVKQGVVDGVISDAYTVDGELYKEIPTYFGG